MASNFVRETGRRCWRGGGGWLEELVGSRGKPHFVLSVDDRTLYPSVSPREYLGKVKLRI